MKATATRGKTTARDGNIDGTFAPDGVERYRYERPVRIASKDWIVFRKIGNLKTSGDVVGPYGVVVRRSCKYAHVKNDA